MEKEASKGSSIWSILLAFTAGAAAGATTAYLLVPENRIKLREAAHEASLKAGRVPKALKEASSAATRAFSESYQGVAGDAH
jgi:hypothetical protein